VNPERSAPAAHASPRGARSQTRGSVLFRAVSIAGIFAAVLVGGAGCARHALPRTFHDIDGNRVPFKRVALHDSVDFFHHWRSRAFGKVITPIPAKRLSADQKAVVDDFGQPDYIRGPFLSQYRESVVEWVHLEDSLLTQYVDGEIAYTGPVTDYEQILIFRGYPRFTVNFLGNVGARYQTLIYRNMTGTELGAYTFADGVLLDSIE
ncbi:MAG TPA: hypothetical protein VM492_05435, partial [Sumerlaeia bacterium]|nr:hypothetical protein [Sumerlaeia bacterium]